LLKDEEEVERERRAILAERQWLIHESEPIIVKDGIVLRDSLGNPMMRRLQRLKPFSARYVKRNMLVCRLIHAGERS
jgi:hypothetical protein